MSAGRAILALNTGSSSLKFALYHAGAALTVPARGEVENSDSAPHFIGRDSKGAVLCETSGATADFAAISKLIQASDAQASSRSS
jgi:acetate kinase